MITRSQIKFIKSLSLKKNRYLHKCFIVEGEKNILELIHSEYEILHLYLTEVIDINTGSLQVNFISKNELSRISCLTSPNKALAVVKMPALKDLSSGSVLLLDSISDPGNLGTIIRSAEWFGFKQIICSKNSVDCYNPKVVQSSMGSLSRVDVIYTDLIEFIRNEKIPVFGTSTEGKSILEFSKNINSGIWIFGSEANGISDDISKLCESFYSIPKSNKETLTESLNLSTSASLVMSYLKLFNRSLDL